MRSHHDGGTSVQRHLDRGDAGADARVFGDVARVVLRHVEVGADEDTLTLGLATGAEIGETDELHGEALNRCEVKGNSANCREYATSARSRQTGVGRAVTV
ncbi:hypothetical protein D9M68_860100 [compost metagenome]